MRLTPKTSDLGSDGLTPGSRMNPNTCGEIRKGLEQKLEMNELEQLWINNHKKVCRETAALHEAGHACFILAIAIEKGYSPNLKSVSIEKEANEWGIVSGEVDVGIDTFACLDQAACILAGWYAQDGNEKNLESRNLKDLLIDKLDANTDCTDDIRKTLELADQAPKGFWTSLSRRVKELWAICETSIRTVADELLKGGRLSGEQVTALVGNPWRSRVGDRNGPSPRA